MKRGEEMFCNKCGHQKEEGHFCSNCGTPLNEEPKSKKRIWAWVGLTASVVLFLSICFGSYFLIQRTFSSTESLTGAQEIGNETVEKIEQSTTGHSEQIETNHADKTDKTVLIKEAMPKVFTIFTEESIGSGFLYQKGGYIITNAHVVAGNTEVVIRNSAGEDSTGKVIGLSVGSDIALVQAPDYHNAEPLSIDRNESDIGLEVIALGSPQGFENSASIGYLTGIGRDIEFGFSYTNLYQVDAQIDQGSSGGPLLDATTGKVIGINSLMYTNQNSFAFSIPMYSMIDLVDSWISRPMTDDEIHDVFAVYENFELYADTDNSTTEEEYYDYTDEYLAEFIMEFGDYYEMALYENDFFWIEDMILPKSEIYSQLKTYVRNFSEQGFHYELDSFDVTYIEYMDDEVVVSTYETFYMTNAQNATSFIEQEKEYTIVIDKEGYYQISDIFVY
ncbi:trypsin-like peptidase domain-containing protein [Sporosarcina saromensis]|uniref:Trypsin-like peptidase domain-containing protein n=2 Tax=Sporosarcina saromensis TaxID=359365 RepID=A0ABU4GDQ6_9BACL|nr:trypsin-like peptidase domain-containing protein [Sporosarcina saromensis]